MSPTGQDDEQSLGQIMVQEKEPTYILKLKKGTRFTIDKQLRYFSKKELKKQ